MQDLLHSLERTILICATRATVFRYFTDSKRFSDWWGEGSRIEGRVGGALEIRYPNGVLASGQVLEILPPEKIVFTYGYESGKPIPPGSSRVTVTLVEHPDGTELTLRHEFADASVRDAHVQGWRYQLALFANVASADQHSNVHTLVDSYFELWNARDASERREKMNALLHPEVRFQDKYSCTLGLEDLNAHLSATHQFMPGLTIARDGEVRQCQGVASARWVVTGKDGAPSGKGANIFDLAPDGRIKRIVGLWE